MPIQRFHPEPRPNGISVDITYLDLDLREHQARHQPYHAVADTAPKPLHSRGHIRIRRTLRGTHEWLTMSELMKRADCSEAVTRKELARAVKDGVVRKKKIRTYPVLHQYRWHHPA